MPERPHDEQLDPLPVFPPKKRPKRTTCTLPPPIAIRHSDPLRRNNRTRRRAIQTHTQIRSCDNLLFLFKQRVAFRCQSLVSLDIRILKTFLLRQRLRVGTIEIAGPVTSHLVLRFGHHPKHKLLTCLCQNQPNARKDFHILIGPWTSGRPPCLHETKSSTFRSPRSLTNRDIRIVEKTPAKIQGPTPIFFRPWAAAHSCGTLPRGRETPPSPVRASVFHVHRASH